jgi:hypothetical protein
MPTYVLRQKGLKGVTGHKKTRPCPARQEQFESAYLTFDDMAVVITAGPSA